MDYPLVSVIIPVYNVEQYLEECIKSVINQSYHNLEIILVDDGSTDRSGIICDEYAKKDDRIVVVHKENGGQAEARNYALGVMKGEYVTFLDSDDKLDVEFIDILMNRVFDENAEVVMCDFLRVDEKGEILEEYPPSTMESFVSDGIDAYIRNYGPKSIQQGTVCAKLYKRDIVGDSPFPVGLIHEDEYTAYLFMARAKILSFVSKQLYIYRIRANSTMTSQLSVKNLSAVGAYEERIGFFNDLCRKDAYIKTLELYCITIADWAERCDDKTLSNKIYDIYKNVMKNYSRDIRMRLRFGVFRRIQYMRMKNMLFKS